MNTSEDPTDALEQAINTWLSEQWWAVGEFG